MRKIMTNKILPAAMLSAMLAAMLLTVLSCGRLEKEENVYIITFVAEYSEKRPAMVTEYIPGTGKTGELVEIPKGIGNNPIQMVDVNVVLENRQIKTDGIGRLTGFPPNPSRPDNYSFVGWFTSGGTEVTDHTVFTTNTRVKARWRNNASDIIEDGFLTGEFAQIRAELAAGQAKAVYNVNYTLGEALRPQTLEYGGPGNIRINLIGTIPPGDALTPTITLSESGSIFTVGRNVTLELRNVQLRGNDRNTKALLTVNDGGTLIIGGNQNDRTRISFNGAEDEKSGGGVTVYKGGHLEMNGGEIFQCSVIAYPYDDLDGWPGGGGVYVRGGTFTMNAGNIERCFGRFNGGAVYADLGGIFTMKGGTIYDNSAPYGGGVATYRGGLFEMKGGKINFNLAREGGGVFIDQGWGDAESANPFDPRRPSNYPGMTYDDSLPYDPLHNYPNMAYDDTPDPKLGNKPRINDARRKEGFYLSGGTISQNIAVGVGGGVCNYQGGIVFMTGGELEDNTSEQFGAGVYNIGLYIMMNGKIINNYGPYGSGVFADGGMFILENGEITGNEAAQMGGGLLVYGGQFTMHGGVIGSNRAMYYGGGIVLMPECNAFAMSGGVIRQNTANNGGGTLYLPYSADPTQLALAYYGTRPDGTRPEDPIAVPGDIFINPHGYDGIVGGTNKFFFTSLLPLYRPNSSGVLIPQSRENNVRMEVIDGELWIGTGANAQGVKQNLLTTGIVPGELNYY
jgi:hypothetical protein